MISPGELRRPRQPSIDRVPAEAFDASNGGLVDPLHAEVADFVKGLPGTLDPMVRSAGRRTESLAAGLAEIPTALGPLEPGESMADDACGLAAPVVLTLRVGTCWDHEALRAA